MSANRQFVAVQFNPWDRRTYTYHNDGEPVAANDKVVVETARGPSTVTVTGIVDEAPPFETKPIVRKVEDEPEAGAPAEASTSDPLHDEIPW